MRIQCSRCGAQVSTEVPDGTVVRAWVECPECVEMQPPPLDRNVVAIQDRLADRARLGLSKYGVTTERTDLSREEWLLHAQAEALDLAVYLQRIISDL